MLFLLFTLEVIFTIFTKYTNISISIAFLEVKHFFNKSRTEQFYKSNI